MTRRSLHFAHPEDTLGILLGGVEKERPALKQFHAVAGGRGRGWLRLPEKEWRQRVVVQSRVITNGGPQGTSWWRHGVYLQRQGASRAGQGIGFDAERDDVRLSLLYGQWQREGDPHVFRVILAPEHSDRLDLQAYTREWMRRVEKDLGVRTQWAAIDHYNTGHAHVHLSIRGRDAQGHELRIDGEYLWGGMKQRAREVATEMLGYRLAHEVERAKARAAGDRWWNRLDEALAAKVQDRRITEDTPLSPYERQRLTTLTEQGLARREQGRGWELSPHWDTIKHHPQAERAPTRERAREEGRGIAW